MKKFIKSEHPRDKEGKFTKKELEGMSAEDLSNKLKVEVKQETIGVTPNTVIKYKNMTSKQR